MRMQSVLVRPYVLECLNKFEEQHLLEEANAKNPKNPKAEFFDKKRNNAKFHTEKQIELSDNELEETQGSSDESSEESEEDPVMLHKKHYQKLQSKSALDISEIPVTPKAWYTSSNYKMKIEYEPDMDRIEFPEYTEQKLLRRKQAPVHKVKHRTNAVNLKENAKVAANLVKT